MTTHGCFAVIAAAIFGQNHALRFAAWKLASSTSPQEQKPDYSVEPECLARQHRQPFRPYSPPVGQRAEKAFWRG